MVTEGNHRTGITSSVRAPAGRRNHRGLGSNIDAGEFAGRGDGGCAPMAYGRLENRVPAPLPGAVVC